MMNTQSALQKTRTSLHLLGVAPLLCFAWLMPVPAACQAQAKKHSAVVGSSQSSGKEKKAVQPTAIYALDIPNTRQGFAVSLNGWPIDNDPGGPKGYFSSKFVGQYIAEGQNTVSISLAASPHGQAPDRFQVRIRSSEGEAFYYDWDPDNPKHTLPMEINKHFEAHLPHGPWAWQTAPKITLDAPTKTAINAFVKRLFDALNTKNVDEATALFAPRAQELAFSQNDSAAEAVSDLRSGWIADFAKPKWGIVPVDYAHLEYTVSVDGRVVQVTRNDGGFVLRDADGSTGGYDIVLCQVKGQWVLIR